ncbi:hypothetical protein ACFQ6O_36545 [Streptomyces sp. NPDC056441]|uniref:hypothetical protein n=1 Tax=Streptomyces sp. NPDC056441 TaxID=3345817 RepID=UPI003695905D
MKNVLGRVVDADSADFGWRDFRDLLVRARIQLGGPIVPARDNVRPHLTKPLRTFITASADWLTVFQLLTYALLPHGLRCAADMLYLGGGQASGVPDRLGYVGRRRVLRRVAVGEFSTDEGDQVVGRDVASTNGEAEIARLLLAAGTSPDSKSRLGSEGTPLCAAACWGYTGTVRQLLAHSADPNLHEDTARAALPSTERSTAPIPKLSPSSPQREQPPRGTTDHRRSSSGIQSAR